MLRAATPHDIEAIVALEATLFDNNMGERVIGHELGIGEGFVFEGDYGSLGGYILVRRDDELLDITRLGVREDLRRRGIGQMLLSRVLDYGCDTILTVRKNNKAALRLYRNNGFEVVAHQAVAGSWILRRPAVKTGGK